MSGRPGVVSATPRLAARAQAQRHERRQRLLRRGALALAAAAPVVLLGWLLLGSSLLALRTVTVVGEARLTAAQVEAAASVVPGTPLARVDTAAVARRVRALGPVAAVTVTRSWPHGLRIRVVERVPVVGVQGAGGITLLDGQGVQIAVVPALPAGVLRLQVPSPGRSDPATEAALGVLHGLPKALRAQVGTIRATTPEQVTLVLHGGRQVLWGGDTDGAVKAAALTDLLRMPGTVFDVSAPGVVTRR